MWQDKVHRVISDLCTQSYEQANRRPNGQLRRRHVPYSVPAVAALLIECLESDDEERAKAVMLQYGHLPADARF